VERKSDDDWVNRSSAVGGRSKTGGGRGRMRWLECVRGVRGGE